MAAWWHQIYHWKQLLKGLLLGCVTGSNSGVWLGLLLGCATGGKERSWPRDSRSSKNVIRSSWWIRPLKTTMTLEDPHVKYSKCIFKQWKISIAMLVFGGIRPEKNGCGWFRTPLIRPATFQEGEDVGHLAETWAPSMFFCDIWVSKWLQIEAWKWSNVQVLLFSGEPISNFSLLYCSFIRLCFPGVSEEFLYVPVVFFPHTVLGQEKPNT